MNYVNEQNIQEILDGIARKIGTGGSGAGLEDWQASHEYAENDICVYNGQIYKAIVGFESDTTFSTTQILEEYEPVGGETIIPYVKDTEISIDDIVSYDNNIYKALYNFVCGEEFSLYALEQYVPQELTNEEVQEVVDEFDPEFVVVETEIPIGVPLGTILPYSANSRNPAGYLTCDGSAISRVMYSDLFDLIGTTYGAGDGTTTFNLPNLTLGEFLEGSSTAGTNIAAGLPNITGTLAKPSNLGWYANSGSGAFSSATANSDYIGVANAITNGQTLTQTFDASRSNFIYGNSTTVQPKSLTVRYIIKAFDNQTIDSALIDITEYADELNQRYDLRSDMTIIYPNGGSEGSPANITVNSRYVEANPFPGYNVECVAEVYYGGEWGVAPFEGHFNTAYAAFGEHCFQHDDGNIVLLTGYSGLLGHLSYLYTVCPSSFANQTSQVSLPCRIKVWKIGKI